MIVTPTGDHTVRIFEYTPDSAKETIHGKLMVPDGTAPLPAVILVHGRAGDSAKMSLNSGGALRERGYASIAADLPFPSNLAVQGGDPEETARRLAACLTILENEPQIDREKIFVYGIADGAESALRFAMQTDRVRGAAITGYGLQPDCPIKDDFGKIKCPVLILHGDKDKLVPIETVRKLKEAIDQAGRPAELKVFENRGAGMPMTHLEDVFDAAVAFFAKNAK